MSPSLLVPRCDAAFRAALHLGLRGFDHQAPPRPDGGVLKHAAVAIALLDAQPDASDARAEGSSAPGDAPPPTPGHPPEAAFVLTRRTSKLRNHAGQWALPGGRLDPGETPEQAALRELHEEVGLALPASAVLGRLDDYASRSGYLITPVVVWAGAGACLVPNPDEVARAYRIALRQILAPHAVDFISIPESDRPVVRLAINGDRIHAPTAAVLYQFAELAQGRTTRVHHLEQPVFAWK
jgi:8-oxo-dGTP pyrophosphatase MutT (NUDIX family)